MEEENEAEKSDVDILEDLESLVHDPTKQDN